MHQCGLLEKLKEYGRPHIIGSYRMDMMAWNDLDINVENDKMSLDKLYILSDYIIKTFHPIWYEAKEERTNENKTVWISVYGRKPEYRLKNLPDRNCLITAALIITSKPLLSNLYLSFTFTLFCY